MSWDCQGLCRRLSRTIREKAPDPLESVAGRAFGRVPPGVASDKDQGRLLQGQESPRNVSERSIRLSRILLSTAAGEEVPGTHTVLRLQPSGQSLGAESHALADPRLGHPTSNTAVVGRCRPADQSPPTGLDCILRTIAPLCPLSLAPIIQTS